MALKSADVPLRRQGSPLLVPETRFSPKGSQLPLVDTGHLRSRICGKHNRVHVTAAVDDEALQSVIDDAEYGVFTSFCGKIGVSHIREYEDRQLKVAKQESQSAASVRSTNCATDTPVRDEDLSQFEEEQLQLTQSRLATLKKTQDNEQARVVELEAQKYQEEITSGQEAIEKLREGLNTLNETLDEKTKTVERGKKTHGRAGKVLDQALKEIGMMVCNLNNVPMEENLRDEMAMNFDEDEDGTQRPKQVRDYGVEVDFAALDDEERGSNDPEALAEFDASIRTEREAEKVRKDSKAARDQFNEIKRQRCELFNKAYVHISDRIDEVYKDLATGKAAPMGGVAYLSLEDSEASFPQPESNLEPYAAGIKYHAMPAMKPFRDMEQLSGGEKTVAALALLFAIHSYQPAPFFVLDE
ncbi:hypothetical protein BU15DRAFT_79294 [Melanogaster broomeanus]|nr:hypothetical protein BU15DRAFT_79294 [Melanogaster broomeanus]